MKHKISRRFVRQGNIVVIKEDIPPINIELDSKAVLQNLDQLGMAIQKAEQQLKQLEAQKEQITEEITGNNESLKDLGKHLEWALTVQLSKIKGLITECLERAEVKVLDTYKYDEVLTPKQNVMQMRRQVQGYVGRDNAMSKAIAPSIIQAHIFEQTMVPKSWPDVVTEEAVKTLLKKN